MPLRFLMPLLIIVAVAVFIFSLITTPLHPLPASPDRLLQTPSLAGTSWVLVSLAGVNGTISPVVPGSVVTAEFSHQGILSGNSGCNQYSAAYTINGTGIVIPATGRSQTKMACSGTGIMIQEDAYLNSFDRWAGVRTTGSSLTVTNAAGDIILVFTKSG